MHRALIAALAVCTLTGTAHAATGVLVANPPTVNFGTVEQGETAEQQIVVTNTGPAPVAVGRIGANDWPFINPVFPIDCGHNLILNGRHPVFLPGRSCTFTVEVMTAGWLPIIGTDFWPVGNYSSYFGIWDINDNLVFQVPLRVTITSY